MVALSARRMGSLTRPANVTRLATNGLTPAQVMMFEGPLVAMEVDYVNVAPGQSQVRHCRAHNLYNWQRRHSYGCDQLIEMHAALGLAVSSS